MKSYPTSVPVPTTTTIANDKTLEIARFVTSKFDFASRSNASFITDFAQDGDGNLVFIVYNGWRTANLTARDLAKSLASRLSKIYKEAKDAAGLTNWMTGTYLNVKIDGANVVFGSISEDNVYTVSTAAFEQAIKDMKSVR